MAIIIDCDPGIDDALALMLAVRCTDLVGVTTVSGNVGIIEVTRNALAILELIGAEVPVHAGAAGPLMPVAGSTPAASHVHGSDGLGGAGLPDPLRKVAGNDAAAYLLEVSRAQPGLWLVAIGPLTNLALAIERDADFVQRLAGISIMGGSTAGGNVTAAAEFNIWADPEAADRVFRSGAAIRLCGLNLTRQFKSSEPMVQALVDRDTVRSRFAGNLLEFLHERMLTFTGERRAALHDPCAVLAVTHPELFEFNARPVAVELAGTLTRGMTVVDERYSGRNATPLVEVAESIEVETALEVLMAALSN